jgi:RiboL-PSP-HEPN
MGLLWFSLEIYMSKALSNFEDTAERSLKLVEAMSVVTEDGLAEELLRAAVVLIVAAMDAYFKEIFMERFYAFVLKHNDYALYARIAEKYGYFDMETILQIMPQKKPNKTVVSRIRNGLFYSSMQNPKHINKLFSNLGIHNLSQRAATNTGKKLLLSSVKKTVERRNKIAHHGDRMRKDALYPIEKKTVEYWISQICKFVDSANDIIINETK